MFNIRTCWEEIESGNIFLNFSKTSLEIIFRSKFKKETSLQFCMDLLPLISIKLRIACP